MIRLTLWLALFLASATTWAQDPAGKPLVRTILDPTEGIVIGQPVRLDVEVLFPGDMPYPPLVSVPEARGAQIMRFETQAVTMRERIAGQDYVGKRFEFILFPRRGGEIAIPAPRVTLLDRSGDPAGSVEGEANRANVAVPAGIDQSGPVLVAKRVGVVQSWSPDPVSASFKTGDAITRTISRQADGVPALGMAEFSFVAPEGVRVYVDPPAVDDRTNRGDVEGRRVDKVTYVFEKAGHYELPALVQPWWSLVDKQARQEDLPGVTVTVAAGVGLVSEARPSWRPSWLVAGASTLVLLGLIALLARSLATVGRKAALRFRASETYARRQLQAAARSGSPEAAYRAWTAWSERLPSREAACLHRDPALGPLIAVLKGNLFGARGAGWNRDKGMALARAVGTWRGSQLAQSLERDPLPALNPVLGATAERRP